MAIPDAAPRTGRAAAKPLPGATWQAHVLDASAITAELNRLWARVGAGEATGTGLERGHGDARPVGPVTRASTLNLIAVAHSRRVADRLEDAITRLFELYPSRATILVADPDHPPAGDAGLDVRVSLLEQEGGKGRPPILFECVTVEVAAAAERHLASIASPLLVADLPDFLWWADDSIADSKLLDPLLAVSDRLIVDSAVFADPGREMRHLTSLLSRSQGCPQTSDFAWARLLPWRQVLMQFFDPPSARDALDELDAIEIEYGGDVGTGNGLTAGMLLAGWLGSCLGWRPPGELLPNRRETGTWRATLRAGAVGRQREVLLTLRPSPLAVAAGGIARVALSAHGGAAGSFTVDRVDALGLATVSDVPNLPSVRRLVYAAVPSDAALLTEELRMFGRDPVYERALAFASVLAPAAGATA